VADRGDGGRQSATTDLSPAQLERALDGGLA
jgi:hypothetical protein